MCLLLAAVPGWAQERTGSIAGQVLDNANKQPLGGVNVFLEGTFRGDATDSLGAFLISPIPPGNYTLKVEHIGYQVFRQEVSLRAGQALEVQVVLNSTVIEGQETVAEESRRADEPWRAVTPSTFNFRAPQLKAIPGAFEDVIRALQNLPGVMTPNDFTSQLLVRGGSPDQNLILLDGIELYSPYRASGMSSSLNPDLLADVSLFTGGYPAIYGDRLSSVLAATIKEGGRNGEIEGRFGANLINMNFSLEGPMPLINGGWIIGIRRTHFDLFADSFTRRLGIFNEIAFPRFEDLQGKMVLRPLPGHTLELTGILNRESTRILPLDEVGQQDSTVAPPEGADSTNAAALSASWHFNPGGILRGSVTGSWYRNWGSSGFSGRLAPRDSVRGAPFFQPPPPVFGTGEVMEFEYQKGFDFERWSVGTEWLLTLGGHSLQVGAGYQRLDNTLSFGMTVNDFGRVLMEGLAGSPNWLGTVADTVDEQQVYGRWHLFAQDKWELVPDVLTIQPSLRYDYYDIVGQGYLSPRLNMALRMAGGDAILNASWGQYRQSPGHEKILDLGRAVGLSPYRSLDSLQAEEATHLVLGLALRLSGGWHARVEAYSKQFDRLIVQRLAPSDRLRAAYIGGGAGFTDVNAYHIRPDSGLLMLPEAVNGSSGQARGLELFLERRPQGPSDRLSGWLAYTYASTSRRRDLDGQSQLIAFDYDRPHAVDVALNYRFGVDGRWQLGAVWRYGSGFPFTPPLRVEPLVGNVPHPQIADSLINIIMIDPDTKWIRFIPDFGDFTNVNSARLPDYHRLDIRLGYSRNWRRGDWEVYLDVINVYNRRNVFFYQPVIEVIEYDLDLPEIFRRLPEPILSLQPVYMFPFLPTLGLSLSF